MSSAKGWLVLLTFTIQTLGPAFTLLNPAPAPAQLHVHHVGSIVPLGTASNRGLSVNHSVLKINPRVLVTHRHTSESLLSLLSLGGRKLLLVYTSSKLQHPPAMLTLLFWLLTLKAEPTFLPCSTYWNQEVTWWVNPLHPITPRSEAEG